MPSGNRALTEPMLLNICIAVWLLYATLSLISVLRIHIYVSLHLKNNGCNIWSITFYSHSKSGQETFFVPAWNKGISRITLIPKFMGPTWGPSGGDGVCNSAVGWVISINCLSDISVQPSNFASQWLRNDKNIMICDQMLGRLCVCSII